MFVKLLLKLKRNKTNTSPFKMLKGDMPKGKRTKRREEKKMSGVLKELLGLLEERLVEHNENRKEVQNELFELCSMIRESADSLEEKMSGEISEDFDKKEERILGLIKKLNEGEGDMDALVKKVKEDLSNEWEYDIQHSDSGVGFVIHVSSRFPQSRLKSRSILTTLSPL